MLAQLKTQVRDEWGVEDVNRQLRRYGAEHFRSALKELRGLDPEALDSPPKLLIKTVRGLAVQYYRDQGAVARCGPECVVGSRTDYLRCRFRPRTSSVPHTFSRCAEQRLACYGTASCMQESAGPTRFFGAYSRVQ